MRTIATTLMLGFTLVLAACNTVGGAGEDIESAGGAISDAADDAAN